MAKPVLGRGLAQLLEAHGAIRPIDGNAVEERPPVPMGVGVRVLMTPARAATSAPEPAAVPSVGPILVSTVTASPTAPSPASMASAVRSPNLTAALLAADVLLCVLAGVLLCHPATRGNGLIAGLGATAVAIAAWLACEAYLLRRRC